MWAFICMQKRRRLERSGQPERRTGGPNEFQKVMTKEKLCSLTLLAFIGVDLCWLPFLPSGVNLTFTYPCTFQGFHCGSLQSSCSLSGSELARSVNPNSFMKRLLLLSNSTNFGEPFLQHPLGIIQSFLGEGIPTVLFVPYAGVRVSYADYATRVRERFAEIGFGLVSVHDAADPKAAVEEAEAIVIGGGNTFHLLFQLYAKDLLDTIQTRVLGGIPYVGWSAGSNLACPTIKTTNDMPIIEPPSLKALNLVPFQINPHYTDATLPNHQGETRAERLIEFVEVNPELSVVGLREGSMLRIEGPTIELLGDKSARVFQKGREPLEYPPGDSLQLLMP
jgi:dipeptidase E